MLWQAVRRWGWNQWCALNHEDWACWTTQPLMTTSDPWGHPLSSIHPIFSFKNNYIIFLLIFLNNLLCKISDFHLFVVKIKQLPIRNWRFRSWGWAYGHYSPQGYFLPQSSCWKEFFFFSLKLFNFSPKYFKWKIYMKKLVGSCDSSNMKFWCWLL